MKRRSQYYWPWDGRSQVTTSLGSNGSKVTSVGLTGGVGAGFVVLKCGRSRLAAELMCELEQSMPSVQLMSMGCIVPIFIGQVVGLAASEEAHFEPVVSKVGSYSCVGTSRE